jgi:hypothetical protein
MAKAKKQALPAKAKKADIEGKLLADVASLI